MAATQTNPKTGRDIKSTKEADGKLTTAGRLALPKKSFALPASATEKGKASGARGSYPIMDKAHARNALARVSQHGTPAEKATVRAKVKAKYPDIDVGGKNGKNGEKGK